MDIKKYSIKELEKGYKGIIDRAGDFYALDEISSISEVHQKAIKEYLDSIGVNILEKFNRLSLDDDTKRIYFFRPGIVDYRAMIIDVLGYCNYEAYPNNDYAVIEVPNPKIANYQITREQQNTLIRLVDLNGNAPNSIAPIFSANQSLLLEIYQIENYSNVSHAGKVKQKSRGEFK